MKLALSLMILGAGAGFAASYLVLPGRWPQPLEGRASGDRPWRRVGAGIVVVLSVMFVIGVYWVDIPDRPGPYALYWIVMLGLVVWLCALAAKDLAHTRKLLQRWRREHDKPLNRPQHDARGRPR